MILLLAGLLDLVGALALTLPAAPLTLHPLAPPLTRIAALGDHPVGEHLSPRPAAPARGGLALGVHRIVPQIGTPEQRAGLATLAPAPRPPSDPAALRRAVEADALAIAAVLGDERVGVIIARKEALAERYGEGRVWAQAVTRLAP